MAPQIVFFKPQQLITPGRSTEVIVGYTEVIDETRRKVSNAIGDYAPILKKVLQEEAAPVEFSDLRSQHFARKAGEFLLEAGFHTPQLEGNPPHRHRDYGTILHEGAEGSWKPRIDGYGPNWIPKAIGVTSNELLKVLRASFRSRDTRVSGFIGF